MSADNWAICPQCRDRAQADRTARLKEAFDAYGKVSPEEFEAMRAAADVPFDAGKFQTFREDYEFYGASDGTITADYSGHCGVCDLGVDFRHEHPFYPAAVGGAE